MRIFDIISFAFGNFFRRKARSVLTVLGVIIGTAAVVIMLSIGIGMNVGFEEQISQWGNIRQIDVHKMWGGSEDGDSGIIGVLNDESYEQIKNIEHVIAATPQMYANFQVILDDTVSQPQIYGIAADSMEAFDDYELYSGRLLNESDIGTTNFVMTYETPFQFYDFDDDDWWNNWEEDFSIPHLFDPLLETYEMTWDWSYGRGPVDTSLPKTELIETKCVGVLVKRNAEWNENTIYMDIKGLQQLEADFDAEREEREEWYQQQSQNNSYGGSIYYSPLDVTKMAYSYGYGSDSSEDIYQNFIVLVDEMDNVTEVEKAIRELGFETYSSMTWIEQQQENSAFLRGILGAIGGVSFVVAALSITNTMIMSIYERTREIGIMKVIGCKVSNIRTMFLVEAGIIGLVGGILGVGASYIASIVVNYISAETGGLLGYSSGGAPASIIPFWLSLVALLLAVVIGVISGLYPAFRATRLSALEAIKNE